MDAGTTTQLITVGATLGGVVLTLVANTLLETRKLRATHRVEALKVAANHANWLRDERVKAYAGLSMAGEEVFQFIRSELVNLSQPENAGQREDIERRWRERRTELRKAYNYVALFGADEPRKLGKELQKAARNGVNDFLSKLDASDGDSSKSLDYRTEMDKILSGMGHAGDRFLDACRKNLHEDSGTGL